MVLPRNIYRRFASESPPRDHSAMPCLISAVVVTFLFTCSLTAAQEQNRDESRPFPLRPTLATQQLQGVSEGGEACSIPEVQTGIQAAFQQFLQEEVVDELSCDDAVDLIGRYEQCPAANCSQIFRIGQLFRFPGYYWIVAENGSTIQVYCDFETEQFQYTTAEIENPADDTCPTMEQRESVQESIEEVIQPQLSQISQSVLECTAQIYGLVLHCPVDSCNDIFDLIHEGFFRLSNYYWLKSPDGDVTEVYCNRITMQAEYSSCQQLFTFEIVPSGNYTIRTSNGMTSDVYCNRTEVIGSEIYESCEDVYQLGLPSATYIIQPSGGSPVTVYCDMDNEECGGGVWTRVASYNYSDPNTTCPGDWSETTSPRGCDRIDSSASCASAFFPTGGIQFSSVCGKVIAIQFGTPDAFIRYHDDTHRTIDDVYVDGVSITHGTNPRQHVWTFAGYPSDTFTSTDHLCPCSQPNSSVPSPPDFVGNNYFCDTGASSCCTIDYYPDDPLWDGQGCGGPGTCCSFNNPPWFSTALPNSTYDDIEVRICDGEGSTSDGTSITSIDLYIQ